MIHQRIREVQHRLQTQYDITLSLAEIRAIAIDLGISRVEDRVLGTRPAPVIDLAERRLRRASV